MSRRSQLLQQAIDARKAADERSAARQRERDDRQAAENEKNRLLRIQLENNRIAAEQAKDARHQQTAEQSANIQKGIIALNAKYPDRMFDPTQAAQYHSEMDKLTSDNAMGMMNYDTRETVRQAANFHDDQRARDRNNDAARLYNQTGLTPAEFAVVASNPNNAKAGVIVEQKKVGESIVPTVHVGTGGFDDKTGKPLGEFSTDTARFIPDQYKNTPWEKIPDNVKQDINSKIAQGGAIQIDTGKGYPALMSRQQYEHFKGEFMQRPTGVVDVPLTPDQQAQAAGYRSAAQQQSFVQGQPLLASAPPGTATTEVSPLMPNGPTPSGGFASRRVPLPSSTGVVQTGAQENTFVQPYQVEGQQSTATLPAGVPPNEPMQVVSPASNITMSAQPGTPTAQPTSQAPSDPRAALAQKALDDPNATEAHKAAARQILGIQ